MYLRLDTQFNPFTYDELVRPLVDYNRTYKEVENAYSTLAEQTEAFKDVVNQSNSPEAYGMYKEYSDALNSVIEDFSRGMTGTNRAQLLNMKRGYARSIAPIARASEEMRAANALRDKAGPDAIFEKNRYTSLDDFLHGKSANNRYQSASAITKKTAAITEAVMQQAIQDPEFRSFLNGQQYMLIQHNGGSYEDLMAAIANNPKAQSRFAEIKKQVMEDSGIDRYDPQGKASIESAINAGLYAGIDKPVKQLYETPELRERRRQFNAELRMRGYKENGEIDPNNPYWKLQGLEYNKDTGDWGSARKPNTSGTKEVVPTYNEIIIGSHDGTRKVGLPKGEAIKGIPVHVEPKEKGSTKYDITVGGIPVASYDTTSKKISIDRVSGDLKINGVSWDNKRDTKTLEFLGEDLKKIVDNEGDSGLKFYNYYMNLDNTSWGEHSSYAIQPLERTTVVKSPNNDVDINIK